MVRIPSYDNYNILGGNTQQAYSNVQASPDAFGAGVGRATEQLGGAMQGFEQQAEKVYKEVKTLDAENRYANETSELFRQADMEYTKAEGKNAIDGYQGAIDRVKKIETETLSNISDPFERMQMSQLLNRRRQQSMDAYGRHQANQLEVYDNQTFQGMTATLAQGAIDNYNDPKTSDWYVRSNVANIEAYYGKKSAPLEFTNSKIQEMKDSVYKSIATIKMNEDVNEGLRYLADNKSSISPAIAAELRHKAQPDIDANIVNQWVSDLQTGVVRKGGEQGEVGAVFAVPKTPEAPPANIASLIDANSKIQNLSSNILRNQIYYESRNNPKATGPKTRYGTAKGLMQLIDGTAKDLGLTGDDVYDPAKNIQAGSKYMADMLDKYSNNYALALMAYNWGPGNLDGLKKKMGKGVSINEILAKTPPETQKYVKNILGEANFETTVRGGKEDGVPSVGKEVSASTATPKVTTKEIDPPKTYQDIEKIDNIEDLMKWRQFAESTIPAGIPAKNQTAMRTRANTMFAQKRQQITDMGNANEQVMWGALVKDKAENGGVFDLERIRKSNPEAKQAFDSLKPQRQDFFLEKQRVQSDRISSQQEKESKNSLAELQSRLGFDPQTWREFPLTNESLNKLTDSDRRAFMKEHHEMTTQKASDPMVANLNQANTQFDKLWYDTYGVPVDGKVKKDPIYHTTRGIYQERIKQYIQNNKGNFLDLEQANKIGVEVLKQKSVNYPIDWGSDSTLPAMVKKLKEGELKNETLSDLSDATEFAARENRFPTVQNIKDRLEQLKKGRE